MGTWSAAIFGNDSSCDIANGQRDWLDGDSNLYFSSIDAVQG